MLRLILNSGGLGGASYTGEKIDGDLENWFRLLLGKTPNEFLSRTYDIITQSCVTLYHTFGPAAAAANKLTDYSIGAGLYFRSQPDYETLGWTQEYARDWARRFQKIIFYKMSELNLYQKQNAAFRWALVGGDTVTYFVRERGRALDIVDFPGTEIDSDNNDEDEKITLGIRHDKFYRREGFYNRDGGYNAFAEDGRQNAVQFYLKRSPRQLRGWPLFYGAIARAKNADRFDDATLATAIIEATIPLITKTENPDKTKRDIENQAARIKRGGGATIKERLSNLGSTLFMRPGNILNINTGDDVVPIDKKTPSGTYGTFKEWAIKDLAMASNIPPEVLKSEYSTSYTAHKGAMGDFAKTYLWSRKEFVRIWCYPVLRELAIEAIANGEIDAPGFLTGGNIAEQAFLSGIWLGPVPEYINPLQEIMAKARSVENGFTLRSDEMFTVSGSDYEDTLFEWQRQERLFHGASTEQQDEAIQSQSTRNLSDQGAT